MNIMVLTRDALDDIKVHYDLHYVVLSGPGRPVRPTCLVDKRLALSIILAYMQADQTLTPYASSLDVLLQKLQGLYANQKRNWILPLQT